MTAHLYGIKNCDTMKKARVWLEANGVSVDFHDYKVEGVDRSDLTFWCDRLGWETVLNRAGTTFRKLPEDQKADLDQQKAIDLMLDQPSMIKRPILVVDGAPTAGFKAEIYERIFA